MLKLGEDGQSAEVVWRNDDLDPHHGGVVLVDGYLYGSTYDNNSRGEWACVDWKTGETQWKNALAQQRFPSFRQRECCIYMRKEAVMSALPKLLALSSK